MAITAETRTDIIELVVGMFDAAPGASVLSELAIAVDAGLSLKDLAITLGNTSVFTDEYPAFLTNQEFATNYLTNFLGGNPGVVTSANFTLAVDAVVALLNSGKSRGEVVYDVVTAVSAVAETDTNFGPAAALLNNQTEVAEYYSVTTQQSGDTLDQLKAVVLDVTGDDATVTAAKSTIDDSDNKGTTFTLTTGVDILTGTVKNDTFVASFDGNNTSTSNLGDEIDGGGGTDLVRIVSSAANTNIPALSNVESLMITDTAHETRNFSTYSGLTSVELDSGTANAAAAGADITVTLGSSQSLTLDSITDIDGTADVANQEGIDIATGSSTALNLTLDGVGALTSATHDLDLDLTSGLLATLNLTSTGVNHASFLNAGGSLVTVNLSGAGTTIIREALPTTLTTFASTATGGVTADFTGGATNLSVTTAGGGDTLTVDLADNITLDAGAGNDSVTLLNPTAANLSSTAGAADSIKGGEGTDTLLVTAAGAASIAGDTDTDRALITGFEQLRTTDDLNATSFDISKFGINYLQVGADLTTAAATVSGFTSGATIEFRDANATAATQFALNVGMTGATGAGTTDDTLNLKLNDNLVNQATAGAADGESIQVEVGLNGINKLNVSTADRSNTDLATSRDDGYTLSVTNGANVDTITVTGDRELSFTSGANTDALAKILAADLTGDLIVNLAGFTGTQGILVTGGSGTNTLTGSPLADQLTGGARADTILTGAGADSVTGGGGADTFQVATAEFTAATAAALADARDKITDFEKGSDIIDDTGAAITFVTNGTAVGGTAAINAEGIATFAAADDELSERITAVEAAINAGGAAAAGQAAIFEHGGNSYLFISEGTDGVGAGDMLIEMTGVTGLADSTLTGGNLTIA